MDSLNCTPQPTLSHELRALINQRNILTAKSKAKVIHALDKQIEENKARQQLNFRNKVIEEIFTSEVSYLRQLEVVMKYFKEPLEASNLMTGPTRRSLFGNLESIYQVNGELVNQLRVQDDNVGAAFLHLAPFFKLYSIYAYDYKNALTLLEDLSKQTSKLSVWIKNQESRPEVGSKLSALLITPIQRLPRYRMLLRQLLSLTPDTHPHHSTLVDAVREVEKATQHINSLVFQQESHIRMVTLQKCLAQNKPAIVAPNKRLLKEGVLMKMSANGQKAQRRYFILLNDSILYCKLVSKDDGLPQEPGSLHCCCVLPISKCIVQSVLGEAVFNLTCRSETYILFSEHRDDASEWVAHIRNAVSQYQEGMRTLRKKSSSRHPLHLNRKRKHNKENDVTTETIDDEEPAKKTRLQDGNTQQGGIQRQGYLQYVRSIFQSFGDSVRHYLYPGPSSR